VDARPSLEQHELADAADRLSHKLGPGAVGDLDDTERRDRLGAALRQAGWRELRTGSQSEPMASGVEAAIVARSLARRACDTAFIGPVLAHDLLRRAGSEGDDRCRTVGISADLRGLAVVHGATLDTPVLAPDVADSDTALVLVAEAAGFTVASIPVGTAREGIDLTRPIALLAAGTPVSPIGGTTTISHDDLTSWTALAVTLTTAELVGCMEGALDLATEYAKERRQYGAPIGSYQAVQHMLSEAKTLTEGSISAMIHAAWAVDALPPDSARAAAAVAKAYASRAARTVCETAIQVHGGIGNTWECMAHVFLRRSLLAIELFGGDGPQLALLGTQRWGATNGLS
jgi:hypothetical protein